MKCSVTLSRGSCRVHFHSIHEIQTVANFFFSCLDLFDCFFYTTTIITNDIIIIRKKWSKVSVAIKKKCVYIYTAGYMFPRSNRAFPAPPSGPDRVLAPSNKSARTLTLWSPAFREMDSFLCSLSKLFIRDADSLSAC